MFVIHFYLNNIQYLRRKKYKNKWQKMIIFNLHNIMWTVLSLYKMRRETENALTRHPGTN